MCRYTHSGHTRNDAKCSDVITALKPTTGTNAARSVPRTTCKVFTVMKILLIGYKDLEWHHTYRLTRGA
jgi:hypothetical protein